jgi:hypothetical protein
MSDETQKMVDVFKAAELAHEAETTAVMLAEHAGIKIDYSSTTKLAYIARAALQRMIDAPDTSDGARAERDYVLRRVAVRGHYDDVVTPGLLRSLGCPTALFEDEYDGVAVA